MEESKPNEEEKYDGYIENDYEVEEGEIPSGEFLMIGRMLENQVKEEESNQRKNIFHTRCLV